MMTATQCTYPLLSGESHDNSLMQLQLTEDCQSVPWTDIELNIINIILQNRRAVPQYHAKA